MEEAKFDRALRELEANPELLDPNGPALQGGFMPFASRFGDHRIGEYIRHLENLPVGRAAPATGIREERR